MFIKISDSDSIRSCLDCYLLNENNGFIPVVACKGGSLFNDPKHTGDEIMEGAVVRGAVTEADNSKKYTFTIDSRYYHVNLSDIIYLQLLRMPEQPKYTFTRYTKQ